MPNRLSDAEALRATLDELNEDEGLPLKPLIAGDKLEAALARHVIDFRDRVFPPDVTLSAFCSQLISADRSCRAAVARTNVDRVRQDLSKCSAATSAYSQARGRLPVGLSIDLAKETAHDLEWHAPASWLWKGRHLKLLDGTTLSMPDTAENQQQWPQNPVQKRGLGFPIMRVVALVSYATGAILNLAEGPYLGAGTGEPALARQLLADLDVGDVLLADRYFAGYFFIALVLERGADMVTRLHHARSRFRRVRCLGKGDHVIELVKPPKPKWMDQATYDRMPKNLELREVKTGARDSDGKRIVVATTLLDPGKYSRSELAAASKMRWNVELDLRTIKTVLGVDVLSCKTPDMVQKELWTYVLAYNLVRQLIVRAAERRPGLEPRDISFTGAVQTFNAFAPHLDWRRPEESKRLYDAMLDLIVQHQIGNRPGRTEPRAVKRRKKVRLLTKPRGKAGKRTTLS